MCSGEGEDEGSDGNERGAGDLCRGPPAVGDGIAGGGAGPENQERRMIRDSLEWRNRAKILDPNDRHGHFEPGNFKPPESLAGFVGEDGSRDEKGKRAAAFQPSFGGNVSDDG